MQSIFCIFIMFKYPVNLSTSLGKIYFIVICSTIFHLVSIRRYFILLIHIYIKLNYVMNLENTMYYLNIWWIIILVIVQELENKFTDFSSYEAIQIRFPEYIKHPPCISLLVPWTITPPSACLSIIHDVFPSTLWASTSTHPE